MSLDFRENLLVRLLEIAEGIDGVKVALRNSIQIDDGDLPAILILDGDEETDQNDAVAQRPSNAPRRIAMTPEIHVILAGKPEDVGTAINAWRKKVILAIFGDAELKSIMGSNGHIIYEGCSTPLAAGREMNAALMLHIKFSQIFNPNS
jgi:hypothetical protein